MEHVTQIAPSSFPVLSDENEPLQRGPPYSFFPPSWAVLVAPVL